MLSKKANIYKETYITCNYWVHYSQYNSIWSTRIDINIWMCTYIYVLCVFICIFLCLNFWKVFQVYLLRCISFPSPFAMLYKSYIHTCIPIHNWTTKMIANVTFLFYFPVHIHLIFFLSFMTLHFISFNPLLERYLFTHILFSYP